MEITATIKTRPAAIKRSVTEGNSIMWVNRSGKYPYTTPQTWNTRTWLFLRKHPPTVRSATARRTAALLADATHVRGQRPAGTLELILKWLHEYDARFPRQSVGSVPGHEPTKLRQ